MWILGAACIIIEAHPNPEHVRKPNAFLELTVDLYVFCLLLLLVPRVARKWVRGTLAVLLYIIAIVDIYCLVNFQTRLAPTVLLLLSETNTREAGEFLTSYLSADVIFSKVGWALLIALLHLIVAINHRRLRKAAFRCIGSIPWRKHLTTVAALALAALMVYGCIETWDNKRKVCNILGSRTIGDVERAMLMKEPIDMMYLPVYRLAYAIKSNMLIAQQLDELMTAEAEAKVDSCTFTSPHIVLIIGESYNKHHASLYGYAKETTPEQQRYQRTGRLIPFTDAVAPWNLTSFVFKMMFSAYTVTRNGKDEWCDYPLFPSLFRKAGYKVDFLTNQFLTRSTQAIYDFSGGFFLNNERLSNNMFDHRNTRLHDYDEGLLADYDSLASSREHDTVPRLTIFHLMGQHTDYSKKFPQEKSVFTIADYDRPDLKEEKVQIIADYDNATRYNDAVIGEIIKRYDKKDAVIIALADHGEEVYDGIRNRHGRMHTDKIGARLAHEEYEIPMWIYCTSSYIQKNPDIFRRIKQYHSRPFMSDALPHLLFYLAGIHTPHYKDSLNILSDNYNEQRPRIMKKRVDYNKLDMGRYRKNEKQR